MVNGISSILKVNSVGIIPQSGNRPDQTKQEDNGIATFNAFDKVLNRALAQSTEKNRSSAVQCTTYTYDSDLMHRDFQYHTREYTY